MSRSNQSSWFPMSVYDKSAAEGIMFGPCLQNEYVNYPYPKEKIKKDEVVIWATRDHKTVSLKSYEKAHQEQDIEALGKIGKLGIPLGCNFGGSISLKKEV